MAPNTLMANPEKLTVSRDADVSSSGAISQLDSIAPSIPTMTFISTPISLSLLAIILANQPASPPSNIVKIIPISPPKVN